LFIASLFQTLSALLLMCPLRSAKGLLRFAEFSIGPGKEPGMADTGAQLSVCPPDFIKLYNLATRPVYQIMNTINGMTVSTIAIDTVITIGKITKPVTFFVSEFCQVPILGLDIIEDFRLLLGYTKNVFQH